MKKIFDLSQKVANRFEAKIGQAGDRMYDGDAQDGAEFSEIGFNLSVPVNSSISQRVQTGDDPMRGDNPAFDVCHEALQQFMNGAARITGKRPSEIMNGSDCQQQGDKYIAYFTILDDASGQNPLRYGPILDRISNEVLKPLGIEVTPDFGPDYPYSQERGHADDLLRD